MHCDFRAVATRSEVVSSLFQKVALMEKVPFESRVWTKKILILSNKHRKLFFENALQYYHAALHPFLEDWWAIRLPIIFSKTISTNKLQMVALANGRGCYKLEAGGASRDTGGSGGGGVSECAYESECERNQQFDAGEENRIHQNTQCFIWKTAIKKMEHGCI